MIAQLFRRRSVWLPTWRGGALLIVLVGLVGVPAVRMMHGFLSVQAPVDANVLVVEGWSPDYALEAAVAEFEQGGYDLVIASGGPMERGTLVTGYDTYAELAAASLRELGLKSRQIRAAPAERTLRNRSFVSAKSVAALIEEPSIEVRGVNVVTVGPHARRSWAVYRKTLGQQVPVGVIAVAPQDYDPRRWWASSDGVKGTLTEGLGWLYETLFDGGR